MININTSKSQNVHKVKKLTSESIVTAEDAIINCEAEKAIDGLNNTKWAAKPYYKWWKIDLLNIHQICKIEICTNREGYSNYFIEYSQDNLNWTEVIEKMDNDSNFYGESYDVSFLARYIRVTITYSSLDEIAQMQNFEVYGYKCNKVDPVIYQTKSPYKFPANICDKRHGFSNQQITDLEPGTTNNILTGGKSGSYLVFNNVDLSKVGVNQLRGKFGIAEGKFTLEIRLNSLDGEKIGEMTLFKQWKKWSIMACKLAHSDQSLLSGIHDIFIIITESENSQALMIHWLSFVKKSPLPAPTTFPSPLPTPSSAYDYKIFFGNLHSHTGFSDGKGVPESAFDYARNTAQLDFLAITEHSNLYDHNLDWDKSRKWKDLHQVAEEKTEDGVFLAIIGSETTWYNEFGHMNTFNMDFFIDAYETKYNNISTYYSTVKQYKDSIQQWNHPWFRKGQRRLDGFEPYDEELDDVLQLLEIDPNVSKECGGLYYYIMALDKGWHISPVGNQDNHKENWGTQNNLRTAVLVDQLTKEHLFDAMRHNRVYFTSALHLQVWFQINGAIMGSRIKKTETLIFDIKALYSIDTCHKIKNLEIFGENGEIIYKVDVNQKQWHSQFSLPCNQRYYFVKLYQDDGEFAVTSPIWIEK